MPNGSEKATAKDVGTSLGVDDVSDNWQWPRRPGHRCDEGLRVEGIPTQHKRHGLASGFVKAGTRAGVVGCAQRVTSSVSRFGESGEAF